jgi:hypothetical protein
MTPLGGFQRLGSPDERQAHPLQSAREKHALEIYGVREFAFTSGNISGQDMAAALELALKKMRTFCARTRPPFVASITRKGEVHLRWPHRQ